MPADTAILIAVITIYALLSVFSAWLVLDARRRELVQQRMQRIGLRMAGSFDKAGDKLQRGSSQTRSRIRDIRSLSREFLRRHKLHIVTTMVILLIPVAATLLLQPSQVLRGYDDLPQSADPVVLALLRGEQLVPPPPLPPEAFITQEVAAVRQNLAGASREWMALDADFRQRLLTVFHLMAQKGYPMALLEGYRSPERQSHLASLGTNVTNAGAYQSFHQYGLAADSAFLRNGKLVISEKDTWAMEGYRLYGELAESVGLVWGGRWKLMDFGHVELRKRGILGSK